MIDYKKILDSVPISYRLQVINEMAFINVIYELGYRTEMWKDCKEDDEILMKISNLAKEHTKYIMEEYERWKKNGRPTERIKMK